MSSLLAPVVATSASVALFACVWLVVRAEQHRNQRLVLGRARHWLDQAGTAASRTVARLAAVPYRIIARLQARRVADPNVTTLMRHATSTPLTVTHTDNHLSKMRDHKSETALTPAQQRKLRKKKLEERF